jgi:hypothetical protein
LYGKKINKKKIFATKKGVPGSHVEKAVLTVVSWELIFFLVDLENITLTPNGHGQHPPGVSWGTHSTPKKLLIKVPKKNPIFFFVQQTVVNFDSNKIKKKFTLTFFHNGV